MQESKNNQLNRAEEHTLSVTRGRTHTLARGNTHPAVSLRRLQERGVTFPYKVDDMFVIRAGKVVETKKVRNAPRQIAVVSAGTEVRYDDTPSSFDTELLLTRSCLCCTRLGTRWHQ